MILERWKCYFVVLDQIYREKNAFTGVETNPQKCEHFYERYKHK